MFTIVRNSCSRCAGISVHDPPETLFTIARNTQPAQVLGELFSVLTRKAGRSAEQARDAVLSWSDAFDVADSTRDAVTAACDLAAAHQLQFWDALIVSVAARQRCRVLLTEDLNEGFVWQGMTVVNPFAAKPHPLWARVLAG